MPVIRVSLSPENAHKFAVKAVGSGAAPKDLVEDQSNLSVNVCNITWKKGEKRTNILPFQIWGIDFPNPVGLAAGFDKDGEAIQGKISWLFFL